MAFPRVARCFGLFWSPVRRVGRSTGRGLATFFGAGWPGLTLGLLAMALGLFGLMGADLRTGLWRPLDGVLGVLLAALGLALVALVLLLLRLLFRAWPARFLFWGLGAFLGSQSGNPDHGHRPRRGASGPARPFRSWDLLREDPHLRQRHR